jgi:hypothetical protein
MIIFDPPESIEDKSKDQALMLHEIVAEEYPKYAQKSRGIIIDLLGQYDPKRLKIFLGEIADGSENTPWFSMEQIKLNTIQMHICQLLIADKEGSADSPYLLDAYFRKHLGLPFKVIEGG